MTNEVWAAKVLEGVVRLDTDPNDYTALIPTEDGSLVSYDEALAAIARMGAGDGLVERAGKYPEILMGYGQGDMDGVMALISRQALHEAADTITDLLAHIAALTAERDDLIIQGAEATRLMVGAQMRMRQYKFRAEAAQADYEARILAALEPAPDLAELVEAATAVDDFMRTDKAYERSGYGPKLRAALAKIKETKPQAADQREGGRDG